MFLWRGLLETQAISLAMSTNLEAVLKWVDDAPPWGWGCVMGKAGNATLPVQDTKRSQASRLA